MCHRCFPIGITQNTGIDFKKFESIRTNYNRSVKVGKSNTDLRNKLYIDDLAKKLVQSNPSMYDTKIPEYKKLKKIPGELTTDQKLQLFIQELTNDTKHLHSGKCLVILSEAPTQLIRNWATRTYTSSNGPIKKMIQHGYHDDKVWGSIFFQLFISMLIMLSKKIMFTDFSLDNNVYIKDLNQGEHNIGLWKYVIDGVDYYVPNYGYLVLIDSNFADVKTETKDMDAHTKRDIEHKIKGTLFKDTNDGGEIYKLCLDKIISVFDGDRFRSTFTNSGGVPPTDEFIDKLNKIKTKIESIRTIIFGNTEKYNGDRDTIQNDLCEKIKGLPMYIMTENIYDFLHTRIGTKLTETESTFISNSPLSQDTQCGTICCYFDDAKQISLFVIFMNVDVNDPSEAKIIRKKNIIYSLEDKQDDTTNKLEEVTVPLDNLKAFHSNVRQYYEPGKQNTILETYTIKLFD